MLKEIRVSVVADCGREAEIFECPYLHVRGIIGLMESSLKRLRMVQLFMLASIVLYAFIANQYGPAPRRTQGIIFYAIAALSISIVIIVFIVRRTVIARQSAILAAKPEDKTALARWRTGHIMIYALCEAVVLHGLVLRFLGFAFSQVVPFYLVGFVLMLSFTPKKPSSAIG